MEKKKNIFKTADFWQSISMVLILIGFVLALVGICINGGEGKVSDNLSISSIVLVVVGVIIDFGYLFAKSKEMKLDSNLIKENAELKDKIEELEQKLDAKSKEKDSDKAKSTNKNRKNK